MASMLEHEKEGHTLGMAEWQTSQSLGHRGLRGISKPALNCLHLDFITQEKNKLPFLMLIFFELSLLYFIMTTFVCLKQYSLMKNVS